jgi:hypothetical protein
MKMIFFLFFLASSIVAKAQNYDSLIGIIYHATSDSERISRIFDVIENNGPINPKDRIYYHKKILEEAKKNKDKIGEAVIAAELGYWVAINDDLSDGTKMIFDALQMAEKTGNQRAIGIAYHDLALIYMMSDPDKATQFFKKDLIASQAGHNNSFVCAATLYLGSIFMQKNQLDSALNYIQKAYELAISKNVEIMLPHVLLELSNLHLLMGKRRLAFEYLHAALEAPFTKKSYDIQSNVYAAIAKLYAREENFDSSLYYGNKAFQTAQNTLFINIGDKADFLRNLYKNRNSDSALKYTNIYYSAKDSIFSAEKVQQLQILAFKEEQRQQHIEEEKIKAEEDRKHNIQYAAIAIGIITFIILFFLLSRSIIVSTKFLDFLGVTGLLLMFEFINLFIHPYLAHATNDSPVLMLLVLVAIAALLVPLHHKLQKWVNMKMVEKNKKIRLAAAKRTVAKLEGETGTNDL